MGLISRDGVIPLNFDRDMTDAMTRTVGDTARMLNVIAGYDPADPITALSEDNIPDDYTDSLQADGLEGARFGVFRRLIDDTADPEVEALFEQAIADLRAAGATIVDPFDVDGYQDALRAPASAFRYDLDNYLASLGPDAPVQSLQEIVDSGEFAEAHGEQLRGNLEVTETPAEQGCAGEPGNIRDNPGRQAFRDTMVSAMEAADLDGLIYPTWDNPPQPIITDDPETRDDLPANTGDNSQGLAPASGQPAITVRRLHRPGRTGYRSSATRSPRRTSSSTPTPTSRRAFAIRPRFPALVTTQPGGNRQPPSTRWRLDDPKRRSSVVFAGRNARQAGLQRAGPRRYRRYHGPRHHRDHRRDR